MVLLRTQIFSRLRYVGIENRLIILLLVIILLVIKLLSIEKQTENMHLQETDLLIGISIENCKAICFENNSFRFYCFNKAGTKLYAVT